MVRIWHLDEIQNNNEKNFLNVEQLERLSGTKIYQIEFENCENNPKYKELLKNHRITSEDELIISRDALTDFDERLEKFKTEHLHPDEEIRYFYEGTGHFDVRDRNDAWIRIEVGPGDLLVLPGGIYHRFTCDPNTVVKMRRYYSDILEWTAYNRPADQLECRQAYLRQMQIQV